MHGRAGFVCPGVCLLSQRARLRLGECDRDRAFTMESSDGDWVGDERDLRDIIVPVQSDGRASRSEH